MAKYGGGHRESRAELQARLDAGEWLRCHELVCLEPTRDIRPGDEWDLGHDPTGTAYIGPTHARCNRSEGGRRSGRVPRPREPVRRPTVRTSREW